MLQRRKNKLWEIKRRYSFKMGVFIILKFLGVVKVGIKKELIEYAYNCLEDKYISEFEDYISCL